jgi:DNA repair protein SbcD/Mre11
LNWSGHLRILHTSDWHVGRSWKGIDRLDEMEAVLDALARFVEHEEIDLVLHTGDIFDSRNPPAEAERLVNRFFLRISRAESQMVVIAGNHDDPHRLDARSLLTEPAKVFILGKPRSASSGGTRVVETRSGHKAVVAALPFASAGAWVTALDIAGDEAAARSKYARMFQLAVQNLSQNFQGGAVNLLMAHTHLEGAVFGESERRVHLSEDWAATVQTLPANANYIALGHIHKPQKVPGALPAYYAGSPLQMDFGEAGQTKTFVVITAAPGKPAKIEHLRYDGGRPLLDVRATLPELHQTASEYRDGWLRVTVPLNEKDPDISRKIRELLPNTLVVRVELPEAGPERPERMVEGASPAEHYTGYYKHEHSKEPSSDLLDTFRNLHAESAGEEQ